jgi:hypothetical protein
MLRGSRRRLGLGEEGAWLLERPMSSCGGLNGVKGSGKFCWRVKVDDVGSLL